MPSGPRWRNWKGKCSRPASTALLKASRRRDRFDYSSRCTRDCVLSMKSLSQRAGFAKAGTMSHASSSGEGRGRRAYEEGMKQTERLQRIPALIAGDLGAKIVSGRLGAGTILDGEVEASGQRQVSRSAYREAVRILRAKGLVESRPKTGTMVSAIERWHLLDPDVLGWMCSRDPSPQLLISLFELRIMVEPEA